MRSEKAEKAGRELQRAVVKASEAMSTRQVIYDAIIAALAVEENEDWVPGVYPGKTNMEEARAALRILGFF